MTLPRRAPPEPSAAAIEAVRLSVMDAVTGELPKFLYRYMNAADELALVDERIALLHAIVDWAVNGLRAAYAVDAPRGVPVTVERLEELLLMSNSWETGAKVPPKFSGRDARLFARWLHAHLVPPEAP